MAKRLNYTIGVDADTSKLELQLKKAYESLSKIGWEGIFSFIRDNGLKITRLDVAYDDHIGILDIPFPQPERQFGIMENLIRVLLYRLLVLHPLCEGFEFENLCGGLET